MTDTELRAALVTHLVETGALHSRRWRHAFEHVPRHLFVPHVLMDRHSDGHFAALDGDRPECRDEWLAAVYSDDTLITQLDGDDQAWQTALSEGTVTGVPTCSSSQPSLMAMMLEALDAHEDHRVLEIGTGTGYNAALMCDALGSDHVTSVDIDAGLVTTAKERLAALGYDPTLAVADGAEGLADAAPYDRVMATCSLPNVPSAWITQTRPGGRILVNLHRPLGGGALAALTVIDHTHASGHFLPFFAGFMPTRIHTTPSALELFERIGEDQGTTRPTRITIDVLDGPFSMFAALTVPAQRLGVLPDDGPEQSWLLTPDSWARQTRTPDGDPIVTQSGPTKLWDILENAYADWCTLDQPPRESIGLTIKDGQHVAQVGSHTWEL